MPGLHPLISSQTEVNDVIRQRRAEQEARDARALSHKQALRLDVAARFMETRAIEEQRQKASDDARAARTRERLEAESRYVF